MKSGIETLEDAFIKTMIMFSSSAEKQIYCYGEESAVADEIAEDFYQYFTILKEQKYFNKSEYLTAKENLEAINTILDECSGSTNEEFWTLDSLRKNPVWENLRNLMKDAIKKMDKANLDIEIIKKDKWTILELKEKE